MGEALVELALGVVVGVAVGFVGSGLLRWARRRGWSAEEFAGIAVLALVLGSYAGARCGWERLRRRVLRGLAFGVAAGRRGPAEVVFSSPTTRFRTCLSAGWPRWCDPEGTYESDTQDR